MIESWSLIWSLIWSLELDVRARDKNVKDAHSSSRESVKQQECLPTAMCVNLDFLKNKNYLHLHLQYHNDGLAQNHL